MFFKVELFISSRACWTVYISYSNFGIRVHKTTFTENDDLQYTCRNVYICIIKMLQTYEVFMLLLCSYG